MPKPLLLLIILASSVLAQVEPGGVGVRLPLADRSIPATTTATATATCDGIKYTLISEHGSGGIERILIRVGTREAPVKGRLRDLLLGVADRRVVWSCYAGGASLYISVLKLTSDRSAYFSTIREYFPRAPTSTGSDEGSLTLGQALDIFGASE